MPKRKAFCKNHPELAVHGRGLCSKCYQDNILKTNHEYRERQKARHRTWYAKNREHDNQRSSDYYKRDADRWRLLARKRWRERTAEEKWESNLLGTYGISAEDFYILLGKQGNVCAICGEPPKAEKKFYVDHNHKTEKMRGLLCNKCNSLVGWMETRGSQSVESAKRYLELHNASS